MLVFFYFFTTTVTTKTTKKGKEIKKGEKNKKEIIKKWKKVRNKDKENDGRQYKEKERTNER